MNRFRHKGWNITDDNYAAYLKELNNECKKKIDAAGINEYNVSEISEYAKRSYDYGRFDEIEAEYMTKRGE